MRRPVYLRVLKQCGEQSSAYSQSLLLPAEPWNAIRFFASPKVKGITILSSHCDIVAASLAHRSPMRSKASSITTELPRMTCFCISLTPLQNFDPATYDLSDPFLLSIRLLLDRIVEHYVEENLSSRELSESCAALRIFDRLKTVLWNLARTS